MSERGLDLNGPTFTHAIVTTAEPLGALLKN